MENPFVWLLCTIVAFFVFIPFFKKRKEYSTKLDGINLEPATFTMEGNEKVYDLLAQNEDEAGIILINLRKRSDFITTAFAFPDFSGGYIISVRESKKE